MDEQLIDASEAVQYLAQKWGIPHYSMDAFKQLRLRHKIKPALASKTATFWRKSDLDNIPKPDRSKPRGPRTKKNGGEDGDVSKISKVLPMTPSRQSLVA